MQLLPMLASSTFANVLTGISAASAVAGGLYQSQVAKNNAAIADQNAVREAQAARQSASIQDQEASQQMGQIMAEASASGLNIGVGSMALRRRSAEVLAERDRGFIVEAGDATATAYKNQAAGFRSDAKAAKFSGILKGVSALGDLSFPNHVANAGAVSSSARKRTISAYRNPKVLR